jgi:hypothetical protein
MHALAANFHQHLSPGTESLSVITNTTQITLAKAKPRSFPEDFPTSGIIPELARSKKMSSASIAQTHHWKAFKDMNTQMTQEKKRLASFRSHHRFAKEDLNP